jgi:hypothetical protein
MTSRAHDSTTVYRTATSVTPVQTYELPAGNFSQRCFQPNGASVPVAQRFAVRDELKSKINQRRYDAIISRVPMASLLWGNYGTRTISTANDTSLQAISTMKRTDCRSSLLGKSKGPLELLNGFRVLSTRAADLASGARPRFPVKSCDDQQAMRRARLRCRHHGIRQTSLMRTILAYVAGHDAHQALSSNAGAGKAR